MTARPSSSQAPFVAVAGLSARMLAQSAARAGLRVAALDLFGDRDTREASAIWFDVSGPASNGLCIDGARLVDALQRVTRLPNLLGWIGTSGVEPLARELLDAPGLPRLIGNSAEATAAVREPERFFALLDALHIAHPAVSFTVPDVLHGWLFKRAHGCGGTHIEAADSLDRGALFRLSSEKRGYFQRHSAGRSLSVLFIGARGEVSILGFAEQLTCALDNLPFVHAGSIGPIDLPPRVAAQVHEAVSALCAHAGLTGINSCDFLLDGDAIQVLEINARPSSTMTLYETVWPHAWPRGLLACHIDACRRGKLPDPAPAHAAWRAGQQVLFSPRRFVASQAFSDACLHDPACRDVPMPGTLVEAGQPVCTLVVRAPALAEVHRALTLQRDAVLERIETCHEPDYAFIHCHS
ncbi:ATP-grasp domain-containing protein [Paraburkholderia sp. A1RI_3L]|uniref:ATP-grasp domain-containing protein n=1 Tax=Paraburkholderia TaxID=1822464 RepID=UPI003B7FDB94